MATLWITATPIGNLGDLSARAAKIIANAGLIVAEDTRSAKVILAHLSASAKVVSFHAHSSSEQIARIFDASEIELDIVYLTDAGTPNISDPGRGLCAYAFINGFDIRPLPGPSAITAALSVCPFAGRGFTFLGFLPRKGTARQAELLQIRDSQLVTGVFEAPSRFGETIDEFAEVLESERKIFVAREMTKIHEQYVVFDLASWRDIRATIPELGEFTIIIDRAPSKPEPTITASQLAKAMIDSGITGRSGLNFLKSLPTEILQSIRNLIYNKERADDK